MPKRLQISSMHRVLQNFYSEALMLVLTIFILQRFSVCHPEHITREDPRHDIEETDCGLEYEGGRQAFGH